MRQTATQKVLIALLGWGVALLLFFPIFWMVLTSFKGEVEAIRPSVVFAPTLESYAEVQARAEYLRFALNSVVVSLGGTLLGLGPRHGGFGQLATGQTLVAVWYLLHESNAAHGHGVTIKCVTVRAFDRQVVDA